jgi:hypothetical protein
MYEMQVENIDGGLGRLLNGLPFGILPLTEGTALGQTIAPIRNSVGSLAPVSDAMQLIDKYKQEMALSSLQRGQGSKSMPAADTATGISLLSQREDNMIAMMQTGCDRGIERSMQLKIQNSSEYFSEPRRQEIEYGEGDKRIVEYYPNELGGVGYSMRVERKKPDVEAGKHMSWFKLLGLLGQSGQAQGRMIPFDVFVQEGAKIGRALGIDDVDSTMNKIMQAAAPAPVDLGGGMAPQGGGAPMPEMSAPDMGAMAAVA